MSWESGVIRVTTGFLNTVNDSVIANQSGITGVSKFGGQLGKPQWFDSDVIANMFDASVGTLYAGAYRYVHFEDGMDPPVVGQAAFWNNDVEPSVYEVTTDIHTTQHGRASFAGVFINVPTPNNYGFIQIAGVATVQYVASIDGTKETGWPVVLLWDDAGLFNIEDDPKPQHFQGWAIDLPADGALGRINLNYIPSLRG